MGNCNFKTEQETDNVAGTFSPSPHLCSLLPYSNKQKSLLVSLCDWKGGLRQGLEGGKEEGKEAFRHEGNAQRQNHPEEECHFRHE
jgi:hypothetical protein